MKHHRGLAVPCLGDIVRAQTLWHRKIHLDRAALPHAPDTVPKLEFNLGAVKCSLTGLQHPFQSFIVEGERKRLFGLVPDRLTTHTLERASRQADNNVGKPKIGIDLKKQIDKRPNLPLELILGAKDMGVILDKMPHPHQSMERA